MRGAHLRGNSGRIARSRAAGQDIAQAAARFGLGGQETVTPEELQEVLWKQLFADTTQWWDNRRTKLTPLHPDFKHKEFNVPLWLNNRHKPIWVDSQLATVDAGLKLSLETDYRIGQGAFPGSKDSLEVETCRKLCEDGVLSDSADAVDLLVQQGCHIPSSLLYRILKRCMQNKDLALGRRIHALTVKSGYEGDAFLATHLIGFYASHGRLEEALEVFTKVPTPDAYNWVTIILAFARHGQAPQAAKAIQLYRQMCEFSSVKSYNRIHSAVLKACAAAKDVIAGKEVHARILECSEKPDRFVQAGLINMYAKCGSLENARAVFESLPKRDVVTWTAMIAGYGQQGRGVEALSLYKRMQQESLVPPNAVTYVCLLQACAKLGVRALHEGKQLHQQAEEQGLDNDTVVASSLVNMYVKCGSLDDARRVFDNLSERNVVAWTAMIGGYAQHGMGHEALALYGCMQRKALTPDSVTLLCLLQACASVGASALQDGQKLHVQIEKQGLEEDVVLGGSIINMYAKCGRLEEARRLFEKIPSRNIVAWNAMIGGYAQLGMGKEALGLYSSMQQKGLTPDSVTYVCLLQACGSVGVGALHEGKQLHVQIEERGLEEDAVLGRSLVCMYAKCGSLQDARRLFDKLPERNVVAWNSLIAGYAQHGMGQEALSLYSTMQHDGVFPDSVTYVCVLQACACVGVGALHEGRDLHAQIEAQGLEEDSVVGGSLVNMYAKCGSLQDAREVFDKLSDKNIVIWNAMIAGYAQQGIGQEALGLYNMMQREGPTPNAVTYICVLQACAAVTALTLGEQLHVEIEERGMQANVNVGSALVNMYAKCGSICSSRRVFDSLSERSMEAWNALISGYARQGDSQAVFNLFAKMKLEGLHPDQITFLGVLTVCSHVGLVDKGRRYFEVMRTDYSIRATMEHYICMVDLLGRAGHLLEAFQMAKSMPFPPNDVLWHTLLGACWKWKEVGIGRQVFECAIGADEKDAPAYVLMSNIYSSVQMWEEAKEMKARRMKIGAWKKPGESWWTDVGGVVHTFLVGDKRHSGSEAVYCWF